MLTKDGVNVALKIIGSVGLDGLEVDGANPKEALSRLLGKTDAKLANHSRVLAELKRQRLVEISQKGNNVSFTLSLAGAYRLEKLIVEELVIPAPKNWDKRWRVVTFDVPLDQSRHRASFTLHLRRLGFFMLQKSMWVHPFPCFEQTEQLAGYYNVLRYCTFFEVSQFDKLAEKRLLNHFKT